MIWSLFYRNQFYFKNKINNHLFLRKHSEIVVELCIKIIYVCKKSKLYYLS